MSLTTAIRKAAGAAFGALGDLTVSAVYKEPAQGAFDPATGQTVTTYTDHACSGVLTRYSQGEVFISGGGILATDRKLLVPRTSLADKPDVRGRFVIGGQTYSVASVKADPAEAVWTIQLRG